MSGREPSCLSDKRASSLAPGTRPHRTEAVAQTAPSGSAKMILGMAQNFIECDREQAFLMPPSLREWLPEDHLAWFVLDAIEEMDLDEFYAGYRSDGHGRAAYEPSMMVALLLYAYATGQRSARAIERHCRQDIAYRVIGANRVPDHATIARFVCRHEAALGGLFGSVLALCGKAGLVSTGTVAIDGTKLKADASREANLDYERIAREIVAEAKATDEAEDELYGEARGDELPEELQTSEGRRRWLAEAKQALDAERTTDPARAQAESADEPPSKPRGRAINQGRRGWLRDARQRLDERREREARPIPRSRQARLSESKRRLEEELEAERSANQAYEAYRSRGISRDGRRFGGDPPSPYQVPDTPARRGWRGGRYEWMRRVLATELGERLYRKRSQTVEPMFGHTKHNRGMDRFQRRGRSAARTEWRLITATHNLTKLHSHTPAVATA
jgi:transposase